MFSSGTLVSLHPPLELARAGAHEHVADHRLDGAAHDHAEHAAEIDLDRVGGPGAVIAEIHERPAAVARLELALLLAPAQPGGAVVREAHLGLDLAPLDVRHRLAQGRTTLA